MMLHRAELTKKLFASYYCQLCNCCFAPVLGTGWGAVSTVRKMYFSVLSKLNLFLLLLLKTCWTTGKTHTSAYSSKTSILKLHSSS